MTWNGVYRGVVLTTSDPLGAGRVRLQVPQVSGTAPTDWVPAALSGGAVPAVSEQVWVLYQGGDGSYPAYLPPIADAVPAAALTLVKDWTAPALATGYTADGNSNGVPQYRVVSVLGTTFAEWRGGLTLTYTSDTLPNSAMPFTDVLPRPSSRRSVAAACSRVSSSSMVLKFDFQTDGTANIVGATTGITPPWVSLNNLSYVL